MTEQPRRISPPAWLMIGLATLVALLPWWRNHHYLRDLYDYGLVISGVARIEAGERAYMDFLTPIQTGTFLFNGWAEKLGDGTFDAMTRGAAGLTILSVVLLAGMLRRRWSAGAAVAIAGAVACMTVAQHTIIWHNALGAVCLAVAAWAAAVAPVFRREQLGWHLLTAAALVIGGITKLNAHLVAVCGVLAWALLHGGQGRASWSRVAGTILLVVFFAAVVPVGFELAWTRATPEAWMYNVMRLPFGSRAGDLAAALHGEFYFTTRFGFYGRLPLPQLGAVGVLVTAAFAVAGLRAVGWRRGGWVVAAAVFAAASGAALLATNYEIAYVAMGAWFALVASLWLGFGLRAEGGLFHGGLVAPALIVGVLAWQSAWQGQRSQFGYSDAPRSGYVDGASIAPDFACLRGTRLPPEIGQSMRAAADWRASLSPAERGAVFYGPGLEWLERVWPTLKLPGMPLWMHGGTSYGDDEQARLMRALWAPRLYAHVLVPEARDDWGVVIAPVLADKYVRRRLGPVWFRYDKGTPGVVSLRPLDFLHAFGGNINSTRLFSTMDLQALADGRSFIGITHGAGDMTLTAPSYRVQGEAVLQRLPGKITDAEATVSCEVFSMVNGESRSLWSAELGLAGTQAEQLVPFSVDSGGAPLQFKVSVPPELAGGVAAGFRALEVSHSVDGPEAPSLLQFGALEAEPAGAAVRRALLPDGWNPRAVYVRNGHLGDRGLELSPGGEIWIRLQGVWSDIEGSATVAAGVNLPAEPVVRVLYLKGGRLEMLAQSAIRDPGRRFDFKAWSAETDGWLVILTEPNRSTPPVAIRIKSAK